MAAHQDTGTLTLLFQDSVGGLEIGSRDLAKVEASTTVEQRGIFRPVDPVPGSVILLPGYLLMRWSNARWKSAVHRVVEPGKTEQSQGDGDEVPHRYSVAFFTKPKPETLIEALSGTWSEERPKRWEPLRVGEWMKRVEREHVVVHGK